MKDIGLVLEGGGLRGVYTAGVLDFFLEKSLHFPYVIGVSAGACNAASYISKQFERNKRINIGYIGDHRYLSYRNFLKEKSLFGIDFVYNKIPNELDPFDYDTFFDSDQRFVIGTTDCITGEPFYVEKNQCFKDNDKIITVIRASSSLPFAAPIVDYDKYHLLDGGISAPIPLNKSISDGNKKHVVILTRPEGYRKEAFKRRWIVDRVYSKYKGLAEAMVNRHSVYNKTLDLIEQMNRDGDIFVLRPSEDLQVDRLEKKPEKLYKLYDLGYEDAKKNYEKLKAWL
ncbi:patatin-like phospholipase family protein [Clostridium manihotivorum]|uniref:Patatin family protein n=1 Tax=Clostridium manihotivorum TaxID=2320868 RepID=A0A410E1F9_9CLOT|nr:patatin family protein [Clostridium manihotivorum]QAA35135.1 patatin family protein [Clostridium manihotivorum]